MKIFFVDSLHKYNFRSLGVVFKIKPIFIHCYKWPHVVILSHEGFVLCSTGCKSWSNSITLPPFYELATRFFMCPRRSFMPTFHLQVQILNVNIRISCFDYFDLVRSYLCSNILKKQRAFCYLFRDTCKGLNNLEFRNFFFQLCFLNYLKILKNT